MRFKFKSTLSSEKDAVKQSILMWDFLRKNPDCNKEDYINKVGGVNWNAHCACCHWFLTIRNNRASNVCFIDSGNKEICPLAHSSLCRYAAAESAYVFWYNLVQNYNESDKQRKKQVVAMATEIVNALKAYYTKNFK